MSFTFQEWQARAAEIRVNGNAWIDGVRCPSSDGTTLPTINPMTEQPLAQIAATSTQDVDHAVASARDAFERRLWSGLAPSERRAIMKNIAQTIREHQQELALLDCLEVGKCISEALEDVEESAVLFDWYGELQDKHYDQVAASPDGVQATVSYEPLGVIGAIVPWNYPLHNASVKLAPALAGGNSVVLKPSEESSLSALRLAELCEEAGLPRGVLHVLPGYGHVTGEALGRHPDIDAIGFTGSTEIGKRFLVYAGESNMKPVWLECGGKSPHIVFDDCADLDAAADAVISGVFTNAGQVCSAHSRLLLQDGIAEEFLTLLQKKIKQLIPGHPLNPDTNLGPIVSRSQFEQVIDYLTVGKHEANLLVGGDVGTVGEGSLFVMPTIFTEVEAKHRIFQEEIFGPVLTVTRFQKDMDSVALANNSCYGLAASLWTQRLSRAHRLCDLIQAGTITVNGVDAVSPQTTFGGMKQSGIGRDYGLAGMHKYMALKTRWIHY
ncbi:aldehyde dehydrogenase PuuC [Salinivibrio sp. SS3]|uniref:aldehyde dehydrogenase family protein n=1 Tax=Salinivibrio sp. SS3 TaxID=1895021 RepID=UPI000847F617|nr:aldehyde dehydrogenase family protein [Salinivibrio sp. BNH]ODP98494.1 aldehyde dehydrogenase PuuC [Salinivibrio sp. BNH]